MILLCSSVSCFNISLRAAYISIPVINLKGMSDNWDIGTNFTHRHLSCQLVDNWTVGCVLIQGGGDYGVLPSPKNPKLHGMCFLIEITFLTVNQASWRGLQWIRDDLSNEGRERLWLQGEAPCMVVSIFLCWTCMHGDYGYMCIVTKILCWSWMSYMDDG